MSRALRIWFWLLLLTNTLVAAWWMSQPLMGGHTRLQLSDPGLELLAIIDDNATPVQLDPQQDTSTAQATLEPKRIQSLQARQCYRVGPFRAEGAALKALSLLHGTLNVDVRMENRAMMATHYWVLLPDISTLAQARAMTRDLSQRGIRDYQIMPPDGANYNVSLGVYSDPQLAQKRLEQIKSLGYPVKKTPLKREATRYWLEFTAQEDGQLPADLLSALAGLDQGYALESTDCR